MTRSSGVLFFTFAAVAALIGGSTTGIGNAGAAHPTALRCGAPVGCRYYCSRSEGERQLRNLAAHADSEDAWIFLETRSLWVDVGEKETQTSVTIDVNFLASVLGEAGQEEVRLSLFHIHPRSVLAKDRIYPPAANDIYCLVNLKHILREKCSAQVTACVLDGDGVWNYDVSDRFESSFFRSEQNWRTSLSASDLMRQRYADFMIDYCALVEPATLHAAPSREQRIDACIQRIRALGVSVSYIPQ